MIASSAASTCPKGTFTTWTRSRSTPLARSSWSRAAAVGGASSRDNSERSQRSTSSPRCGVRKRRLLRRGSSMSTTLKTLRPLAGWPVAPCSLVRYLAVPRLWCHENEGPSVAPRWGQSLVPRDWNARAVAWLAGRALRAAQTLTARTFRSIQGGRGGRVPAPFVSAPSWRRVDVVLPVRDVDECVAVALRFPDRRVAVPLELLDRIGAVPACLPLTLKLAPLVADLARVSNRSGDGLPVRPGGDLQRLHHAAPWVPVALRVAVSPQIVTPGRATGSRLSR